MLPARPHRALVALLGALCIAALLAVSVCPSLAADAVVTRKALLRRDPSTARSPITRLEPPDEVELISPTARNGYYHVRDEDGEEGWIWGGSLRLLSGPPPAAPGPPSSPGTLPPATGVETAISPSWDKPKPNQTEFQGLDGVCGPGDGGDTATNTRKNRTDLPASDHEVTWHAIATLPYPKPAPTSRAKWTPAQLAQLAQYEGVALRVEGYIVALKPQDKGKGESTNCHFTHADEVDWHIALVANAGDGENTAIVVETTPRVRRSHPKWTPEALRPWVDADQPIRISGWLMFDPDHPNHLGKYRSTLWEIHPITKIEVLKDGAWVDLDVGP
jgi:hypothetical protein